MKDKIKIKIINECNKWKDEYCNHSIKERHQKGQWFTPGELIIKMIDGLDFSKDFLDPAAGNGNILASLLIAGVEPHHIFCNELDEEILNLAKQRLQKLAKSLYGVKIPEENFTNENAENKEAYQKDDFIIIQNPPYIRGSHKKIFKEASKHGLVYSLQPVGTWKTHEGNIKELLPLHTSNIYFDTTYFPMAIFTNSEKDIMEWNKDFSTLDKVNGTYPLYVSSFLSNNGRGFNNGVKLNQEGNNVVYFKDEKERTNFIKNVGKIVPLQLLFFSGIFPTPKQRLCPPLDREYSKDELLDYFGMNKKVYKEYDDLNVKENYRCSYDRFIRRK